MSTYRQEIQDMVEKLQDMYDRANYLRDQATAEEKKYWNGFRGRVMEAWAPLQNLDDLLSMERAKTPID